MMQRNALSDRKAAEPCTDFYDSSGRLMSKNSWRRHGSILNFLDVGRTDAARGDFHEELGRTDARDRKFFETDIIHATVHRGAHRFWNFHDCRHQRAFCRPGAATKVLSNLPSLVFQTLITPS